MRKISFILLTVLVISLMLGYAQVNATAGTMPRNPKPLHIGQFLINGEIVSIDNMLALIHTDSYSLVGSECTENFYSGLMLWGEKITISITSCPDHDSITVLDREGEIWDF